MLKKFAATADSLDKPNLAVHDLVTVGRQTVTVPRECPSPTVRALGDRRPASDREECLMTDIDDEPAEPTQPAEPDAEDPLGAAA